MLNIPPNINNDIFTTESFTVDQNIASTTRAAELLFWIWFCANTKTTNDKQISKSIIIHIPQFGVSMLDLG